MGIELGRAIERFPSAVGRAFDTCDGKGAVELSEHLPIRRLQRIELRCHSRSIHALSNRCLEELLLFARRLRDREQGLCLCEAVLRDLSCEHIA